MLYCNHRTLCKHFNFLNFLLHTVFFLRNSIFIRGAPELDFEKIRNFASLQVEENWQNHIFNLYGRLRIISNQNIVFNTVYFLQQINYISFSFDQFPSFNWKSEMFDPLLIADYYIIINSSQKVYIILINDSYVKRQQITVFSNGFWSEIDLIIK